MNKASKEAMQQALITQVEKRRFELKSGELYSLDAILGEEFWDDEDYDHKALGRYFSELVIKRRLPFEYAGWTKQRHNRYRYIPRISDIHSKTTSKQEETENEVD